MSAGQVASIFTHPHLTVGELGDRYRAVRNSSERTRWHIPWQLARGRTATELSGGDRAPSILDRPDRRALQRAGAERDGEPPTHDLLSSTAGAVPGALGRTARGVGVGAGAQRTPGRPARLAWVAGCLGRPVSYRLDRDCLQRLKHRYQAPRPGRRSRRGGVQKITTARQRGSACSPRCNGRGVGRRRALSLQTTFDSGARAASGSGRGSICHSRVVGLPRGLSTKETARRSRTSTVTTGSWSRRM